jgi:hypothetical protein
LENGELVAVLPPQPLHLEPLLPPEKIFEKGVLLVKAFDVIHPASA